MGNVAYANDQILLFPGRRDDCWEMGGKNDWTAMWNSDPDYLNKNGK